MAANPKPGREQLRDRDGAGTTQSRRWLLERYWLFGGSVLVAAAPLFALWGSAVDMLAVAIYLAITAVGWTVSRRSPSVGALLHLFAMFPFWAWYVGLEGGLPRNLDAGVAEYAVLLIFPILTLVTMEGLRGGAGSMLLAVGGLLWRFEAFTARVEGIFLLSTAVLIGMVFRKLARELDLAQERMRHMAFHDELTGLANRRELQDRARKWLDAGDEGALLFVDLDRFKTVNDVLGHSTGDEVLMILANRLREQVGNPHLVARIGGDEFAVLLRAVTDAREPARLAQAIVERLNEPCEIHGRVVHIGASIGIALWPEHGRDLESLMKSADVAMFRAKQHDVAVAIHRPDDDEHTLTSRGLEVDLYRALEGDELRLHYQPVKDLASGEIVGAEALVRWRHPERGTIAPGSFIELAEETGHILAIDQWVLRHALAQLKTFDEHGYEGFLAINISARSLEDDGFGEELTIALAEEGTTPDRLVLEITESAAMLDPEGSLERLAALQRLGVRIAIDDFGMGYSSLAYLKRMPASHIKLDRSFTWGIGQHVRDEELIEMVLQLAKRFKLEVVAEGVEEEHQASWLAERGCGLAQGYAIARPMKPSEFLATTMGVSAKVGRARPSEKSERKRRLRARARRSIIPRRSA